MVHKVVDSYEGLLMKTGTFSNCFKNATAIVLIVVLGACGREGPDALVASGREYLAKKDYSAASIQLKNALQQRDSGEIRYLLAKALIGAGDYAAAQIQLRQALVSKYSTDAVYPELSRVLLLLGDAKNLVAELGNVTVGDPAQQASIKSEAVIAAGKIAGASRRMNE